MHPSKGFERVQEDQKGIKVVIFKRKLNLVDRKVEESCKGIDIVMVVYMFIFSVPKKRGIYSVRIPNAEVLSYQQESINEIFAVKL